MPKSNSSRWDILGIDPGKSGVLAFYDSAMNKAEFHLMPMIKHQDLELVDGEAVADLLYDYNPNHIVMEQIGSMGQKDITHMGSASKLMVSYGIALGACMAMQYAPTLVRPNRWKKDFGLIGKAKKASVIVAEKLVPKAKKDLYGPRGGKRDGHADALLIALWYQKQASATHI